MLDPILCFCGQAGSGRTQALVTEVIRRRTSDALLTETLAIIVPTGLHARQMRQRLKVIADDSGQAAVRVMTARQLALILLHSFECVAHEVLIDWIGQAPCHEPIQIVETALLTALAREGLGEYPEISDQPERLSAVVRAWLDDGPASQSCDTLSALFQSDPRLSHLNPIEIAGQLTRHVLGQSLIPRTWLWPVAEALVERLISQHPQAMAQLSHQFRLVAIDDLPEFSESAQTTLGRLAMGGLNLVVSGDFAGIQPWLASLLRPRTLETLPQLAVDPAETRLPQNLPALSDWLSHWGSRATFSPSLVREDSGGLEWLTLRQLETFDEEVVAVVGQLNHWTAQPLAYDRSEDWAIVVPSGFWRERWIEALSLAGLRDPDVALSLTLQSRLLSASRHWVRVLDRVAAFVNDTPLTPNDVIDLFSPEAAQLGLELTTTPKAAGWLIQTIGRIQAGESPDHWLAPLMADSWSAQDQPLTLEFWQALEAAVLGPLRQVVPMVRRVAAANLPLMLSLYLAKLENQTEPLASDAGLPCQVVTFEQARAVWVDRLFCVSLMEQLANPFDQLGNISAEIAAITARGSNTLTPDQLREGLPNLLNRARCSLWLSTHTAPTTTEWTPSAVVEELATAAQSLTGQPWPLANDVTEGQEPQAMASEDDPTASFLMKGWNALEPAQPSPLWPQRELLPLSPTAIEAYMRCPRQFYYKHLLRLPDDEVAASSSALLVGQLTHKLLELFNRQVTPATHTAEQLLAFAKPLLAVARHRHDPPPQEWAESREYQEYRRLSPLEQGDMTHRILAALGDLGEQGYFSAPIVRVLPEVSLRQVRLPEWPDVALTLTADALLQRPDGRWDLVDYKTYGPSAFNTAEDKNAEKLATVLAPLDLDAPTHADRFPKKDLQNKKRLVQLPLYHFAFSGAAVDRESGEVETMEIRRLILRILRAPQTGNPRTGSIAIDLPVEAVNEARASWLADYRAGVVEPIRQASRFETSPEPAQCGQCAYRWLCDGSAATDSELDSEGDTDG